MGNKKKMKYSKSLILSITIPVVAMVLFTTGFVVGIKVVDHKIHAFDISEAAYIKITPQTTEEELLQQINENLHPKWPSSVRRALKKELENHSLVPGLYRFTSTNTAVYFARSVTRGWGRNTVKMTIIPTRSLEVVAAGIAAEMMVTKEEMMAYLTDPLVQSNFGIRDTQEWFEHILPDTYELYWSATPAEIMKRVSSEYDEYWNEERVELAKKQKLSPEEVLTLASIIDQESNKVDEYGRIASVYLNRLHRGWKLQADPTVNFIFDYQLKRVTKEHLKAESPYNTYLHEGLPPAPICLPSKAAIEAVLNPDNTHFMFFCASDKLDGHHEFAVTSGEHYANANRYHDALDRLARDRKAAEAAAAQAAGEDGAEDSAAPAANEGGANE